MPDPAFAAYNGHRVTLPDGRVITGKPLDFMAALRLLELLDRYERGESVAKTMTVVLQEFPAAAGIDPAELVGLTLGEVNDVIRSFFYQRRWNGSAPNPAMPRTSTPAAAVPATA